MLRTSSQKMIGLISVLRFAIIGLFFISQISSALIVEPEGSTLKISGKVSGSSDELFAHMFSLVLMQTPADTPITLELDSEGGGEATTHAIIEVINSAREYDVKIRTVVKSGARCFSSCVMLFASGDERWAAEEALFLFHGFQYNGFLRTPEELEPEKKVALRDYLAVIRKASPRLATFLDTEKIIENDETVIFKAQTLKSSFSDFLEIIPVD